MVVSLQMILLLASIGLFFALLSLIFAIVNFRKIRLIQKNLKAFFAGKNGKDLEAVLLAQVKEIQELDKEIQELFEISNKIHNLSQRSIHKTGVVRFNPFKDIGGDQSFALALLDGKDSGLVISSLHTREGTRIYSKPVLKGNSEKYSLTEEEKQAIKIATETTPKKI